jgi:hypothetical protein
MKVIIYKAFIILISIIAVPLVLGYINWDITTITRAGEWSKFDRFFLGAGTVTSIAFGVIYSMMVEER